jgi:hypothetical protein
MKKLFLLLIILVAGLVGGFIGRFVTVMKWGIKEGKMSRVYEESRIGAFGSNAFAAYLHEPPDAGIYALKYHLAELESQERKWGTNWAVLRMADVNWMRASANVRLANLYNQTGKPELGTNHLEAAWQAFSQMGVRVRGISNRSDLISYISQEDKKGKWW